MKKTGSFDIYAVITDRIIADLEKGLIPWEKPWSGTSDGAISRATGKPYSLLNQILLGRPGEYLTFKQVQELGGRVNKGAKASMVVFWKVYPKQAKDADGVPITDNDGNEIIRGIPVLRYFNVFHIEDTEGIAPKYVLPEGSEAPTIAPAAAADEAFADYRRRSGVLFRERKQDRAYYSPSMDMIALPLRKQFQQTAEYYSTLFHEATHSTGHHTRLNRFDGTIADAAFGSEDYSKEELVAEIGAAAILNTLGLETKHSARNTSAYIQSWLRVLRNDKRMIVSAATRAEKAVRLILNQPDPKDAASA